MASAAANSAEQAVLHVGPSSKQTGDLVHDGIVIIEGAVTGRIHAREVRILASGVVDASIHADVFKVMGTVRGSVKSATVLVGRGAEVADADIQCEMIGIEPGARFDASTRTLQPGAVPRFDYDSSWSRLNPQGMARPVHPHGRAGFAVVEGGAGRAFPRDEIPPAYPEERSFPSSRM
ncbi:bactofilin family protein [Methylobacterium fujisawaense]|jgi:cytoskeletal protein CcmA (bactofilin family)